MTLYYDPAGAFYDSRIHGEDIPAEAVQISAAKHAELMDAQGEGREIYMTRGGNVSHRARSIPIAQRRAAMVTATRREAARRIEAISPVWRQLNDFRQPSPEGEARFAQVDGIRAASAVVEMDIAEMGAAAIEAFDIASHPAWPDFTQEEAQ